MHFITDIYYFNETNLIYLDNKMSNKPHLIKLKTIETLLDTVLSGNIYKQAVIPLLHGEIIEEKQHHLIVSFLGKEFKIRTDLPINTNMDNFIKLLREQVNAYVTAGSNLFKQLTDINSLAAALTTENTFSRSGVTCVSRKLKDPEDGVPMIMEYKISTQFLNKEFKTTDEDEVLTFLGSMARQYSINMQRPDPNWYNGDNERPTKQTHLSSTGGRRPGKIAMVGGPRTTGAALAAALAGSSAIEASASKE